MLWMLEEILAIPGVSEIHGLLELVYRACSTQFSCYWMEEESYSLDRIEMSPSWVGEMAQFLRAATSQLTVICNSRSRISDAFF